MADPLSGSAATPATDRETRTLKRIELATAIVLSTAGLVSSWASYQAALWGGVETAHYARANSKVTEASRLSILDGQAFGTDMMLLMAWLEAAAVNDVDRMAIFEHRFSPELRSKFDPWRARFPGDLRTHTKDPLAPRTLPRPDHAQGIAARALQRAADLEFAQAEAADNVSDRYIAATVVLSTVLFLGGISPLLKRSRIRLAVLLLAGIIGVAASVFVFSLPIEAL